MLRIQSVSISRLVVMERVTGMQIAYSVQLFQSNLKNFEGEQPGSSVLPQVLLAEDLGVGLNVDHAV
jgi:hypothetical protein